MADRIQQFIESSISAIPYGRTKETHDFSEGVMIHNGESFEDFSRVMGHLPEIGITTFQNFNAKMQALKDRFMAINLNEKRITRDILGIDANVAGDSDLLGANVPKYSYTAGRNYTDFMSNSKAGEPRGVLSTRSPYHAVTGYDEYVNLYPDEYNKGLFEEWITKNDDESILAKTKRLFDMHKINTIISAFGTNTEYGSNDVRYNGSVRTMYGESKGRNLLTKDAEMGRGTYDVNGYKNPYCRVWTHHYQYNKYGKTMRTFSQTDGSENFVGAHLPDIHRSEAFQTADNRWGWKSGEQIGWTQSVLNTPTGMVNITPKYLGGGGMNKHTKDCMFSIENLAWKDYDPYSFEQALSWEQRGPLGGRIMWFPPYGISVTESATARWNENEFIGRGEKVYTYTNSERTATLSFMMVVDHPSIIDYATYYDGQDGNSNGLNDNDIHRFFAGCDYPGSYGFGGNGPNMGPNPGGMFSVVRPTPLTDEGVKDANPFRPVLNGEGAQPKDQENSDDEPVDEISFYVFYPNNYSGCYDNPINQDSEVDTIAYLLAGKNTNKQFYGGKPEKDSKDIPISFFGGDASDIENGVGYEINNPGGISDDTTGECIVGNKESWQKVKDGTKRDYIPGTKFWWYRIDGEYKYPDNEIDGYRNTYGQTLNIASDYKDSTCYNLNSEVDDEAIRALEGSTYNQGKIFSLTEIVQALIRSGKIDKNTKWKGIYYNLNREEEIDKLSDAFKREIESVECVGFSNSHGNQKGTQPGSVGYKRNKVLAVNRAKTVLKWLDSILDLGAKTVEFNENDDNLVKVAESVPNLDVNAKLSKIYRSAKCTIRFKKSENKKLAETQQDDNNGANGSTSEKYVGYTKTSETTNDSNHYPIYVFSDGYAYGERLEVIDEETGDVVDSLGNSGKWVEIADGTFISLEEYEKSAKYLVTREEAYRDDLSEKQLNKVRYDQEYHFFRELKENDPFKFDRLMDKLKYFDPAFHSMTPEGFNARLTFLNQCLRQGDTVSASDINGKSAKNLAFGRPPFCVLRLGDFYRQLVVIDSIDFDYNESNGLLWDLNQEGIGAQPMLCKVTMRLKLIGGGDISGPIRRLQNAMSFNYYANTSLYDNRADRTWYHANSDYDIQMGGNYQDQPLEHSEGNAYAKNVYAHNVERNLDFRIRQGKN